MTNILTVSGSPNSQSSVTQGLIDHFVEGWKARDADARLTQRDIGRTPPPHLDEATIGAFYTPADARSDEQLDAIAHSDELVSELETADVIVIGSPMHNFGLSSGLKAWVDHVARVGRTFNYTDKGPVGLLTNKKVYVLTARGGDYSEGKPASAMDFQAPYLRTVLGFIGLDDITFIHAQGVAMGEDGVAQAKSEIDAALDTSERQAA